MIEKRLFLGGGGDKISAKEIDDLYGKTLGIGARVLYVPVAWEDPSSFDSCLLWFKETYKRFGFSIEMLTDLNKCDSSYLNKFDSVYIGGGNTFSLLHTIRKTNFSEHLINFINAGKVVYGGSAGAIILGKDIRTASLGECSDLNEVGVKDFAGLDMVNGFAIHCHYMKEDSDAVELFSKEKNLNIIALTEESGLFVEGDKINHIGEVANFIQ